MLVDLPGVRDANAARGAVAEKYMKKCNAIWIVASITRAVDDRTAKVQTHKAQLCSQVPLLHSWSSQICVHQSQQSIPVYIFKLYAG